MNLAINSCVKLDHTPDVFLAIDSLDNVSNNLRLTETFLSIKTTAIL